MVSSWYRCGSKIVNRHTGMVLQHRPKTFVETQVERLGPEGAMALFSDARKARTEDDVREAVLVILASLADRREWSAMDLWFTYAKDTVPLCLALEALVQTNTIIGPSPYGNEPTGDMSELVYELARDDGGEEYPF